MISNQFRWLVIFFSTLILSSSVLSDFALAAPDVLSFDELLKEMEGPPPVTPPEIQEIENAESLGDESKVINLSNAIISRPNASFGTLQSSYYIKSLALMHRGQAQQSLGGSFFQTFEDYKKAADLGNLQAVQDVNMAILHDIDGSQPIGGDYKPNTADIQKYFMMAAELGDSDAAEAISLVGPPFSLPDSERTYWLLMGLMRDHNEDPDTQKQVLQGLIQKIGPKIVKEALQNYSLVGGPIDNQSNGIPKRGLIATLFVDSDLRGTFEKLFEIAPPNGTPPPVAPTIKDQWTFYQDISQSIGYVTPYLLIPGNGVYRDPDVLLLPLSTIISDIQPDDRVFLRCGPLDHVAVVYKIDRNNGYIYFSDAAFQFWQPSDNACVTSFELVNTEYNRLLSKLSLSEVSPMLQAVITMRDGPVE